MCIHLAFGFAQGSLQGFDLLDGSRIGLGFLQLGTTHG
jgi:hypothetical protein